jgi:hypothetical protein
MCFLCREKKSKKGKKTLLIFFTKLFSFKNKKCALQKLEKGKTKYQKQKQKRNIFSDIFNKTFNLS